MTRKTKKKKREQSHREVQPVKKTWKTDMKEEMKVIKLLRETESHDHKKCDCEGCYWWNMTSVLTKNGRFYEVIPAWKDMDRDEFIRSTARYLRYQIDKKDDPKKLKAFIEKQGATPEQAEIVVKRMMEPVFMVMYGKAPSKLGLLRDM